MKRNEIGCSSTILVRIFICEETEFGMDGMHMIERKQDALNGAMLRALMAEHLREEREKVQHEPIQDASFSALASRIVEDAKSGTTHKSTASNFLSELGVDVPTNSVEQSPLRHVGQRAKKIPLKTRRVRKVKRTSRAPASTRTRPAVGHERPKRTVRVPRQ